MAINRGTICCLVTLTCASVVSGIFFTNSKENDYPRIGKRCQTPGVFYNSFMCRNFRTDGNKKDNSPLGFPDLRPKYMADVFEPLNTDIGNQDSTEDIFKPKDVKAYRIPLRRSWAARIKTYLSDMDEVYS